VVMLSDAMLIFILFYAAVLVSGYFLYAQKKSKEVQTDYWIGAVAGNLPFVIGALFWLDSVEHLKPNPENDWQLLGVLFLGFIGVMATLFYYFLVLISGVVITVVISSIRKRFHSVLIFIIVHFITAPSALLALYFAWQ
jgi:hypothetical protein